MIVITDSGHLTGADWNEGTLTIQFRSGDTYEYYDVPFGIYQELLGADSKSTYFRNVIKGSFEYSKV